MKGTADFIKMKLDKEKIVMVTAYDYISAGIAKEAGIDIVLVGDSLATTVQGKNNTIGVTLEEMIYHTKIVKSALTDFFVVCDMPFMSYQVSSEQALINAGRILKESGANGVKMEGGELIAKTVKKITETGIPVVAHIGLMPQFINVLGGYKVQGRIESQVERLVNDAVSLEKAGAFMIVLEAMPEEAALSIQSNISIPTIGIGAGRYTDGQVLVFYDAVGMLDKKPPKFVKKFADSRTLIVNALKSYKEEVKNGSFPAEENIYK
ncbi:MAG: 3-methyl-2-oxobutanoate hydroxymethyltransferase [Deltaproteobacteria bacterium]|jgi:3-methyl-2-oxobutanoate hydroxymethyltransferase|nr:3-methyl-2-oxobutanoate hydroxymethyltransferase [Deltaproteobacteria bacterium]MCL5879473.1 3-methyl-2-oxobutanoate hydroxymethyltransferase [Deltaproteobacteria bacterium]MDA8304487.1 3-methyl-2-oxobutanoate hydroxymethyltransferase [Deltaproteobacteria bacterium]